MVFFDVVGPVVHTDGRGRRERVVRFVLLARIYYERNKIEEAWDQLEKGVANDFKVRQYPLFPLVRAQVCAARTCEGEHRML